MTVACFDIGGTAIKTAFITDDNDVLHFREYPTPKTREALLHLMAEVIGENKISAIALSVPGAVNQETGHIEGLSAVPYIHGISWYDLLKDYHVPIYLENDANCVGLSELAVDSDSTNMTCVVIGTGIGGALIINRQLVRGYRSYGGEFGYMMVQAITPPLKNWSQLASTGSLVRRVQAHPDKAYQDLDGKAILTLAEQGDNVCRQALDEMIGYLAHGLINIFYMIAPEVILIGGAISQNPFFMAKLQERLKAIQASYPEDFPEIPRIKACHFTYQANLVGAFMNTKQ